MCKSFRELQKCHLFQRFHLVKKLRVKEKLEYGEVKGKVIARTIYSLQNNIVKDSDCHAQLYMMHKVIKVFTEKGKQVVNSKLLQKYQRGCFEPVAVSNLP